MHVSRGKLEQGEETYGEVTAMEEFFERNCFIRGYHVYRRLESRWCANENTKTVLIDTLWPRKRKELSWDICIKKHRGCVRSSCDEEVQ